MMREDVELLDRSLNNLGNTFRQNRLDKQSEEQRGIENSMRERMFSREQDRDKATSDYRNESLGVQKERATKATEHEKRMEGSQKSILEHAQAKEAIDQLVKAHKQISDNVAKGVMSPQQANAAAKRIIETMQQGQNEILQNSPFGALLNDPNADLYSSSGTHGNLPTEWSRDPSKEYVTKAGAVVPPRKDKLPTETSSESVRQIPNPNFSVGGAQPPTLSLTNRTSRTSSPVFPPKPAQLQPVMGKRAMMDNESMQSVGEIPGAPVSLPSASYEPAPSNPSQRVAGKVYKTPKGMFLWDGQGWKPAP